MYSTCTVNKSGHDCQTKMYYKEFLMQIAIHFSFSLLLSTVSGEDTQDRTDRILLTPWVKFLWESFRNILELLKNNSLMERIYTDVAKRGASMHVHVTCSCLPMAGF